MVLDEGIDGILEHLLQPYAPRAIVAPFIAEEALKHPVGTIISRETLIQICGVAASKEVDPEAGRLVGRVEQYEVAGQPLAMAATLDDLSDGISVRIEKKEPMPMGDILIDQIEKQCCLAGAGCAEDI